MSVKPRPGRVAGKKDLSPDVREVVGRALAD